MLKNKTKDSDKPQPTLRYYSNLFAPFEHEPMRDRLAIVSSIGDNRGEGLQALTGTRKGNIVFAFRGTPVGEQSLHTLQIAPGHYVSDPVVMCKVLHSCNPNMGCDMVHQTFRALRDIEPGEMLTMDYESTEDVLSQAFHCECGSQNCRGEILGRKVQAASVSDDYKRIVVNGIRHYGQHLILCGIGCNESILNKKAIAEFMPTLARRIGMVPFGNPFVERFGGGIEVGISGVQLIETSAITLHTNDGARDLYLDVFSCKEFLAGDVLAAVMDTFAPLKIRHEVFLRQ